MAKAKKSPNAVQNDLPVYELKSISTVQYAFLEDVYDPAPASMLSIDPTIAFEKNIRLFTVSVGVQLRIWQHDNNPFLVLEITNDFGFSPDDWAKMDAETGFILPRELAIILGLQVIATARGILHAKLEDTPISKFILPFINVREVFRDDMPII